MSYKTKKNIVISADIITAAMFSSAERIDVV
jgi:hypothetical protein